MKKGAALAALLTVAGAGVAHFAQRLDAARRDRAPSASILYLPSGRYLKVVSLGFPELLADMVYIWSIQFYGRYDHDDRFEYLEHVYGSVISELDPRYIDPYLVGSMIMTVEAKDQEMAIRLLEKGIAANPDEWILLFEAGFISYNELGDHERAARYFERALAIPGAPDVIRRLHAEMYNKMGDKRRSLGFWREIYEKADSDYVRDVSWRHLHDLIIEVDLQTMRDALAAFKDRAGSWPRDLKTLVRDGLLPSVPVDPEGRAYVYDAGTGEVKSATGWRLYRRPDR